MQKVQQQTKRRFLSRTKIPFSWDLYKDGGDYYIKKIYNKTNYPIAGQIEQAIYKKLKGKDYILKFKIIGDELFLEVNPESKTLYQWMKDMPKQQSSSQSSRQLVKNELIQQLVDAVRDIHSHDIAISDFKPDNILIFPNNKLKIIDFDASYLSGYHYHSSNTAPYSSPQSTELNPFSDGIQKIYNRQVLPTRIQKKQAEDLYVLGIIIYYIMTNRMNFPDDINGPGTAESYTREWLSFLKDNSIYVEELLPMITANIDISKLLRFIPSDRSISQKPKDKSVEIDKHDHNYQADSFFFVGQERKNLKLVDYNKMIHDFCEFILEKINDHHPVSESRPDLERLQFFINQARKMYEARFVFGSFWTGMDNIIEKEILILLLTARKILMTSSLLEKKKYSARIITKIDEHSKTQNWTQLMRINPSRAQVRRDFSKLKKQLEYIIDPRRSIMTV